MAIIAGSESSISNVVYLFRERRLIEMAVFLGIHKVAPGTKESQIAEGYNKYKESAKAKGLNPLSAVVSLEKGFAYCQTEAQSADQVREAHEAAGVPLEDVVEVKTLS